MVANLSPGLILILGALLVPVLRGQLRSVWLLALPVIALLHLLSLPAGDFGQVGMMGMTLTTLRVDGLSLVFGCGFLAALFLALVYGLDAGDAVQQVAAIIYAGAAIGAVFAGDLLTLFIFWQIAAVASAFVIWTSRSEHAFRAGMRYVIIQVAAGLLLLEGLLMHYHEVHEIGFGAIGLSSAAGWMILAAFGIGAAFPLLHAWLPDSYSKASPASTVILSAITTKLAVYGLLRGFAGAELLLAVGIVMIVFGLLYAAVAGDLRRVLCYVLIAETGVMVAGVGIGTGAAEAGVAAHALANILYMSLLFMAVGAGLRAGRFSGSTITFAALGAASIGLPLLSGFVGRSLILAAAADGGHLWTGVAVLAAGAGAFVLGGVRLVSAMLGSPDGAAAGEPPGNMRVAMGIAAVLSLALGLSPFILAGFLPAGASQHVYSATNLIAHLQLLAFGALGFVLVSRAGVLSLQSRAVPLDLDWTYRYPVRKAAVAGYEAAARTRALMVGAVQKRLSRVLDHLDRHHGPEGIFAGNWPTGAMAFWTTALLAVWLIAYYV